MAKKPPRRTRPAPPDDERDNFELEAEDAPHKFTNDDELASFLATAQGGSGLYVTVYRVDEITGKPAWCPGRLAVSPKQPPEDLYDRIYDANGSGHYNLQFREVGRSGSIANLDITIAGRSRGQGPAPASNGQDELTKLLRAQNDQVMGMLNDALKARHSAPPPPSAAIDDQLKIYSKLFSFSRGLAQQATQPQLPPWVNQVGEAISPVLIGLGRLLSNLRKPPAAGDTPPASLAESPAQTGLAGDAPDPIPEAAAAHEAKLREVLVIVSRLPNPDPQVYAALAMDVAGESIRAALALAEPGTLAASMVEMVPELGPKAEFCKALEAALRERITKPGAAPC